MSLLRLRNQGGSDLARLHRDMDDLFGSFFGGWPTTAEKAYWPAMDVSQDENEIEVKAELPGCKPEDIDINVHGTTLTISGEKKAEEEKKEKGYYHIERSYGSFQRQINLPSEVDPAKVKAAYDDGILTITLPKAEKAKSVKIEVKKG